MKPEFQNKGYVLYHRPTDTYCTDSGWHYIGYFKSKNEKLPHVWNKPGQCKASVTSFLKVYHYHTGEAAKIREQNTEFAMGLEICEVEITPVKTVHQFIFDIDKMAGKKK